MWGNIDLMLKLVSCAIPYNIVFKKTFNVFHKQFGHLRVNSAVRDFNRSKLLQLCA